jgi:hypothetical protein
VANLRIAQHHLLIVLARRMVTEAVQVAVKKLREVEEAEEKATAPMPVYGAQVSVNPWLPTLLHLQALARAILSLPAVRVCSC